MLEQNEKQQQASLIPRVSAPATKPKPKMVTDPLSENNAIAWPQLAASWAGRQHEMPEQAAGVSKLKPMNFFERLIYGPTTQAVTYPWGTVAINRQNVEKNNVNLDNLLVHELTHVGQKQREGIGSMFSRGGSRDMPDYEREAYDAENTRYKRNRLTDISLPSPKTQPTVRK